jgi:small subunit ribosomal protein S17
MSKKVLQGTVISTKLPKTLKVRVVTYKKHEKYEKKYIWHKNYLVHYEGNDINEGEAVLIEESVPYSKLKKWIVKQKA